MTDGRRIEILDCTIRDGSYLINYQFTAEDTYVTASALCDAGIERIEVGHGVGLDAQSSGKGRAADAGLDFIRVGTNIDEFESGEEAIKLGKECGLEVWSNLMKSYVATPQEFGAVCARMEAFGADVAVLVDSAGGLTPDHIRAYTQEGLASVSIRQ